MNYSSDYIQGHETRYGPLISVIIEAKNHIQDGLMSHNGLFKLAKSMDEDLKKIEIETLIHGSIKFQDICAKSYGQCQSNQILELSERMSKIRQGLVNMTYPLFEDPLTGQDHFLPANFGSIKTNSFDNKTIIVEDISAMRLSYILDTSNPLMEIKAKIWESAALDYVLNKVNYSRIERREFISLRIGDKKNDIITYCLFGFLLRQNQRS
jgi:hypothetical protein